MNAPSGKSYLRHTAQLGDVKTFDEYVDAGLDISELDNAPLRWALIHRHHEIVRRLIKLGVNFYENVGEFLAIAAKNGDAVGLKLLLDATNSPIDQDELNHALFAGIASKNPAVVRMLLRAGANATAENDRPAIEASCVGSPEILQLLFRHGANLDLPSGQPLFNAVFGNHWDTLLYLLRAAVDPNAQSGTALILAISNGQAEMVELLLAYGAKLVNPVFIANAADSDSLETLLLLLEEGYQLHPYADVVVQSAAKNAAPRVLRYVLEREQVQSSTLDEGLLDAVQKASGPTVDILLKHGANPQFNGSSCLKIAVRSHEFVIAQRLIEAGARVTDLDASAVTTCIEEEEWEFLRLILRHGVATQAAQLTQNQSKALFFMTQPRHHLFDTDDKPHPKSIRDERSKFLRAAANLAAPTAPDRQLFFANWLKEFCTLAKSLD